MFVAWWCIEGIIKQWENSHCKKCILHRKICAAFWKANSTKSSYLKNFRKYATKKCFKASNLMIIITQLQFLFNLVHNITSYDRSNLKNLFFSILAMYIYETCYAFIILFSVLAYFEHAHSRWRCTLRQVQQDSQEQVVFASSSCDAS